MKTHIITLRGHDFVVSTAAITPFENHLKAVRKATWFRPHIYRENIEALCDLLIEQGRKPISKAAMVNAIRLVGMPDGYSVDDILRHRFPKMHRILRRAKKIFLSIGSRLRRPIALIAATGALVLSVSYAFLAFRLLQASTPTEGTWQTIETSIGRVRSYVEPSALTMADDWVFSWQASLLLAVLLLAVAIIVPQLLHRKHRLPFILAVVACACFIAVLWQAQQQAIATRSSWVANTQPLMPRLAYLQQCGDEIPYVFDSQTAGMLFRQLRDEGFVLTTEVPTNYGHPDGKQLCTMYDQLRQKYARDTIVLQLYTKQEDGTPRTYMFSDAEDNTGSYGFFVKQ